MKQYKYLLAAIILAVIFNSCKKGSKDIDVPPDPEPPKENAMLLPKKQMRATWMATVFGLDWPQGDYNTTSQKQQYIAYLEKFKQLNMNAVFVQIKGMGDAFYNSPYEPWSANITGSRGQNPGYDVLKYMIDEAHARNLEFHAWINPFRIATRASNATPYPPLHSSVPANWVVSHEKWQLYNPAIPEARNRLADIVKDIITKYNVDGIHMDDYFYPDPSSAGQMVSDAGDYATYGAGYSTIEEFRRSNVDKAIKAVYDVIVASKPEVIFSISPTSDFTYNRNTLYADIRKWATEGWMDVVIPQIYHNSNFAAKLTEWDMFNNKPNLMIGHGYYLMNNTSELTNQFNLTKNKKAVVGSLLYSAKYLNESPALTNKLAEIFATPAVIPFLGRAVASAPTDPQNVRIDGSLLKWTATGNVRSVVYYTPALEQESRVIAITNENQFNAGQSGFYCVSTLNADNKESKISATVKK
ncbi:glycoside hydrolase family 10 protein [Niabella ginsengisoli]|uniref:Family 10 glycosylhydrolase n=1 Tax=Niabella ginsengisoli TaxID=522298 RepID=A0ABS9SEN6_9BACT|nr:family 10 glycosylhydrolase [Niabella ginsengisoli]MCH5596821.1 family 10 glycosylhydrolase [Niabella ginsengisoli]